jgi:hypothetical protein
MYVGASFVGHLQAPEAIEPREGPLHHPPKPAQPLARFNAASRDAGDDAAQPTILRYASGSVAPSVEITIT